MHGKDQLLEEIVNLLQLKDQLFPRPTTFRPNTITYSKSHTRIFPSYNKIQEFAQDIVRDGGKRFNLKKNCWAK